MTTTDLIAQADAIRTYSAAEDRLRRDARYARTHDAPDSARRLTEYADRLHRAVVAEHTNPAVRR